NLVRRGVGDAEVPDQALVLKLDEGAERLGERAGLRSRGVAEPEVDQVEPLEAEGFQVLVDGAAQVRGPSGGGPATLFVAPGADLGHDVQRSGVRVQRLADQLVGDAGAVGAGGVDVGDAEVDG